jgi:hypothetical protein
MMRHRLLGDVDEVGRGVLVHAMEQAMVMSRQAQFKIDCAALCEGCASVYGVPWFEQKTNPPDVKEARPSGVEDRWVHPARFTQGPGDIYCQASRLHAFHLKHPQ